MFLWSWGCLQVFRVYFRVFQILAISGQHRGVMMESGIIFIDYLKVIGLFCIILAHVCTNPLIFQIRNFDVPLMVIISGFLAIDSYKRSVKNNNSLLSYYSKRIKRLVIPTWIFLTFYFFIIYIVGGGVNFPYDLKTVFGSYLLLDGIGYVWI